MAVPAAELADLTTAPTRIVSLVPSTTESVVALAGPGRLVGCTRYCTEPADLPREVVRVGGTKNPSVEAVCALRPDLVLGNAEENRPEDLAWLAARVPVVVQTPTTVADALQRLRELAVALQAESIGQQVCDRLQAVIERLSRRSMRPLRVFYAIWRKPWMSVNASTYIHDVLRLVGAENVAAAEVARYPEVSPPMVHRLAAEAILLPDEPWRFDGRQLEELRAEATFGAARLVLCDGRDFCWHGVRAVDGLARAAAVVDSMRG